MTKRKERFGAERARLMRVPFSSVPAQSDIFVRYLADPASLGEFYTSPQLDTPSLQRYASTVLAQYSTDRDRLCDALAETNAGAAEAVAKNILRLRNAGTTVVVTGQQAGLFTGPLYTIYKALTAIALAERLTAAGTEAVPVFWAATEDHDFDEVESAWFRDTAGELFRVRHHPAAYRAGMPVGGVTIDESITGEIDALMSRLPQTMFSDAVRQELASCWRPGRTFSQAFCDTISGIFGPYGLIVLDPMHRAIREMSSPTVIRAIDAADEIGEALARRSEALSAAGFHSQVMFERDYFPLFWMDDAGLRRPLRRHGTGRFRAKEDGTEFAADELRRLASDAPERLSPGVMLRPVVEDDLLPTVCYIGGGAEVAYFAQVGEVRRVLGRPPTPIVHRQSFTVLNARQRRYLDKLGIAFEDLFEGRDSLRLRMAATVASPETARVFAEAEEIINGQLNRLDAELSNIDTTLAEHLAVRRCKIIYHVAAMRRKTLLAVSRNNELLSRRLDELFNAALPNNALQERTLNVFAMINEFGPTFIDRVYGSVDLEISDHQVLDF